MFQKETLFQKNLLWSFAIVFGFSFFALLSEAKLNPAQMKKLDMPLRILNGDDLDTLSSKMIPPSLTASDSSQTAVTKIIDQSLSYWWTQSNFRNTPVGRTAAKVENKLKVEANLGPIEKNSKVDHKLSLRLMAAQALAKLEYNGWVQAAFNYDIKASRAEAQLIENITKNKAVIISHSTTPLEKQSQLSLRWDW